MSLIKKKKRKTLEEFVADVPRMEAVSAQNTKELDALECCERLITASKGLEEIKNEYRKVTDYLSDIQILEELPNPEKEKIRDTALSVVNLTKKRQDFSVRKRNLSEQQFTQIDQEADTMPNFIKRLQNNESYQSMIKHDLDCLEGEKSQWLDYKESIAKEKKILQIGLWVILVVFSIGMSTLLYFQYAMYMNLTTLIMVFLFFFAILGGGCIIRLQNDKREEIKAHVNINKVISLSNQLKSKYVHITNAVDHTCERFSVRSAMELNYLWEQYMETMKEREIMSKTCDDLEYFSKKLVRDLKKYHLYDATIWMNQASALIDKKEMVEVKHELVLKRQEIRKAMEQQLNDMQNLKKTLLELVRNNKKYQKEVKEVLKSLDEICKI